MFSAALVAPLFGTIEITYYWIAGSKNAEYLALVSEREIEREKAEAIKEMSKSIFRMMAENKGVWISSQDQSQSQT